MHDSTFKPADFKRKTLAAAIALTFATPAAFAGAPSANQLPGNGVVTKPDGSSSNVQSVSHGASPGTETIQLKNNANTVITWGGNTGSPTLNTKNQPGGFNIGPYAHLSFQGNGSAVLNIDASGKPSHIMGTLTAGNPHNVDTFVANGNGIIVGSGAKIKVQGIVGLVGESGGALKTDGFGYSQGSGKYDGIVFNGTSGGDVSVAKGASIRGSTVLVAGGSSVNVNLNSLRPYRGVATVMAGESLINGTPGAIPSGSFGSTNKKAVLTVTGTAPAHTAIQSAGNVKTTGTTDLTTNQTSQAPITLSAGNTLTNTGILKVRNPSTWNFKTINKGELNVTLGGYRSIHNTVHYGGNLINKGTYHIINDTYLNFSPKLEIKGGNLVNSGTFNAFAKGSTVSGFFPYDNATIRVHDGSITNSGVIKHVATLTTLSDSTDPSFTSGADYSITNSGLISGLAGSATYGALAANDYYHHFGSANNSTGSVHNSGTLQVLPTYVASTAGLDIEAHNNIRLGGTIKKADAQGTINAVSSSNPLNSIHVVAKNGTLTISTPLAFLGTGYNSSAYLKGQKVRALANVSGVTSATNTSPAGSVDIYAGSKPASGYAISVGSGATVSANKVEAYGQTATDHPNVLLNGTLAGNKITLGGAGNSNAVNGSNKGPVSDVLSNPSNGSVYALHGVSKTLQSSHSVATTTNPTVTMNFTGKVKVLKTTNQSSNFRFRYLPINSDGTLNLKLHPVAYRTNGTTNVNNGNASAVNILVNNNVNLHSISKPSSVPAAGGTSTNGTTSTPNTHLVLQSTGNIDLKNPSTSDSGGRFYWPGYLYLGTIQTSGSSPAPGTLSQFNEVRAQTNVNNVLPGYTGKGSGMHLMTQHLSLQNGANVVTNYNNVGSTAQSNYKIYLPGSTSLATHYGNKNVSLKIFYGGTLGSGSVVNYSSLVNASNFHAQSLNSTR